MSSRTSPTILCANHWHDDNRGDSAISEATVTLLRERWPASNIRIVTLNEPISIGAGTVGRHLTMAHPNVLVEPSLVPTENGSWAGTDSAGTPRSRIMIAMRGGVWLLRLLPFALGFLVGRVPPRVAKRLAGVDMMVLLGGSDIYDNPSVLQVLSLARLFTVLYPLWAASELGIPVVVLGHTIGPLSRPIGRRLTTRLLGLAQSVVVRESTSLALVKALGLRNAVLAPDMAFALNPRRSERVEEILSRLPLRGGEALCLVVRQHPHMGDKANNRLLDELEKVAANYLAVDASRWVVVVAQVHGPTTIEDDRPLSRKLAGRLPLDRSILVDADLSAGELSALYGSCRLMVAVRLHAAILAMVGGTPAYAISYFTAKSAGVMDDLGLGDSVGVFDKVTAGQIDQALRDLDGSPVRTRLREVRAGWRSALTSIVNSWPDPTLKSRETLEAEDAWAS